MYHIFYYTDDRLTVCGANRDGILQQGSDMCPDCKAAGMKMLHHINKILGSPLLSVPPAPVVKNIVPGDHLADATAYAKMHPPLKKEKITMSIDLKATIVKSVKQGACVGAIKAARKKLVKHIAKKWPAIMLMPADMQDLALCMLISLTAKVAPERPAAQMAESVAATAIESVLTTATSELVQELIGYIDPMLEEIAKVGASKTPKEIA